ncbi:MAG: PIN domain-containing protein [Opitutaceae bacterium]|nr:PIN domain-containing protein [Opitutaceae bacterium]
MRVFLDSSVLLAASGSPTGASRAVIALASRRRWTLFSCHYCRTETLRNLPKVGPQATPAFDTEIEGAIRFVKDRVASENPLVFPISKDRPVVITALAEKCDVLLTLDRTDFQSQLGGQVYGMLIRTPGDWLEEELGKTRAG